MNSNIIPDKNFELNISSNVKADIYLSCSWRPDAGQDAAWHIVREFDSNNINVVGDVTDQQIQDDLRIERIMSTCDGFVGVLPFRPDEDTSTSPFIYREILIAKKLRLPIILFYDSRIRLSIGHSQNSTFIKFADTSQEYDLKLDLCFGVNEFIVGERTIGNLIGIHLNSFIESIVSITKTKPYVFLITRLESDFEQIREAISTAIFNSFGISCLWSDDGKHSTNINSIRERARLLIKHSHFVIADLSFDQDNPLSDNPSRSHEVGMSIAYQKEVLLCSQVPRRDPYYSASDIQIEFWSDEKDLEKTVVRWLETNKAKIGRRVYNFELKERDNTLSPNVNKRNFNFDKKNRYLSPNLFSLTSSERWITAIGLGLIVFSLAKLLNDKLNYGDTLDFAAIMAGIFTFLFSSEISTSIQHTLGKHKMFIFLLLISGIILFAFSIYQIKGN